MAEAIKAKAVAKAPVNSKLNKDGVEKGKVLSESEYWSLVNKSKAKK